MKEGVDPGLRRDDGRFFAFFFLAAFLLCIIFASPVNAQEAPGEEVPGADSDRVHPFTEPAARADQKVPVTADPAPGIATPKELSPQDRQELEKLFQDEKQPAKAAQPASPPLQKQMPAVTPPPPAPPAAPAKPVIPFDPAKGEIVVPEKGPHVAPPAPEEPPAPPVKEPQIYMDITRKAVLHILNKQTTRLQSFEVNESGDVQQGTLNIKLVECWHSPADTKEESAALLNIWEKKPGQKREQLFYGWMFASSPSLNTLEHPVYDVTVVECK